MQALLGRFEKAEIVLFAPTLPTMSRPLKSTDALPVYASLIAFTPLLPAALTSTIDEL